MADYNSTHTGLEIDSAVDKASALPSTLGTAGQVLKVNSGATGIEWASGGTKLYKHHIIIQDTSQNYYALIIISLDNEQILLKDLSTKLQSTYLIRAMGDTGENIVIRYDTQNASIKIYSQYLFNTDVDASFNLFATIAMTDITTFVDTVTPL